MYVTEEVKLVQAITIAAGAAAATDLNGTIIDMAGYDNILFVVQFGPIVSGAATSIKVQQDTDVAGGTMADLTGSAQTVADDADNTVFYVDVRRPAERYVRVVVLRATQAATCSAMAYLYRGGNRPPTHGAGVSGEKHGSPAEGTA